MRRIGVLGAVLLINFILQTTIFEYIAVLGIKPNTAIVLIVCYSILRGDFEGAIFGFFTGLLQDLFFGKYIGLYALLGLLTGFVCGKPFKNFYRENYLLPLLLTAFSVIGYEFLFYATNFLFRAKVDWLYYLCRVILPEAVYTGLFSIPLYRLFYIVNSRLEKAERHARKLF